MHNFVSVYWQRIKEAAQPPLKRPDKPELLREPG